MSRLSLALVLLLAAAALGVAGAEAGQVPAVSGTVTMTSEPGDFIGAGQTYSYDVAVLALGASYNGDVTVRVDGGLSVSLGAPGEDQLSPGTYEGAVRFPDASQPYLDVSGDGRGCNETFGSFTVDDVEYGPHGYIESLHASFEQHCEKPTAPALRGEVDVRVAPPPAPLEVGLTFNADGTGLDEVTGRYFLYGSVECSQEVFATVMTEVREVGRDSNGVGSNGSSVQCSPVATDWLVMVSTSNNIAFTAGALEVELRAEAIDEYYSDYRGEGFVYSTDEVAGSSEVGGPSADPGSGLDPGTEATVDVDSEAAAEDLEGVTGLVAQDPAMSVLVALGILVVAVLSTALLTLLIARRRYRGSPTPEPPGPE